jgi:hypothetical protein
MQPLIMARMAKHLPIKVLDTDFVGFPRPVGIMTLKGRSLTPLALLFADCAREIAKSLAR